MHIRNNRIQNTEPSHIATKNKGKESITWLERYILIRQQTQLTKTNKEKRTKGVSNFTLVVMSCLKFIIISTYDLFSFLVCGYVFLFVATSNWHNIFYFLLHFVTTVSAKTICNLGSKPNSKVL